MPTTKELFTSSNPHYQSLEFWANEKDGMVYSHINDEAWIDNQLNGMSSDEESLREELRGNLWNPTTVGNVSYLALNSPTENQRKQYLHMFEICKDMLQNDMSTDEESPRKEHRENLWNPSTHENISHLAPNSPTENQRKQYLRVAEICEDMLQNK